MAGPKYRLLEDHYLGDQYLAAGTIIGDGTPFPYVSADGKPVPPSRQMEPLNDEAKREIDNLPDGNANPLNQLPVKGV